MQPAGWDCSPPRDLAQAQNAIVDTSPAEDAEVTTQPAAIVMTFESEVPEQRDVQVVCEGNPFSSIAAPELGEDGLTLTVAVLQPLPAGDCDVAWTLTNDDGSTDRGEFGFTVAAVGRGRGTGATTGPTTTVAGDHHRCGVEQ